ncbi:MAG: hypothetical protein KAG94_01235 [Clostridiales bacterium]|nr:hypothetical protein [Clostridiales bacterium]
MTFITVLITLLALSVVTYLVSLINNKLGAYFTIVTSLVTLLLLFLLKNSIGQLASISLFTFKLTTVGWYFSMVMVVVYFTSAFLNPFWMKKMIYPAAYNLFYLVSLIGTIGMFFARDFITLFIFWETVVWTSTFIIQMGKSRKSSYVYYVVSAIGSMVTLFAMMLVYQVSGTLEISVAFNALTGQPVLALIVFFTFLLAGLSKIGIFPFHVWLPMAHGSAPHTFSPVLSGGLVKMGAFIAYISVSAFAAYEAFSSSFTIMGIPAPIYIIMVLGAISIVVGTVMAIRQDDAKKLLAYSSVANGGYILIGILLFDQLAFAGGMLHLVSHAIASATAFITIAIVAHRTGTTKMSKLGGMIHKMPITYTVYLIAIISMAGIPPMGGFVSKWLILQGLADHGLLFIAAAAFFGSIGSFMYVFRPLSAVFLGQLAPKHENVKEASIMMQIPMYLLTIATLLIGVFPKIILKVIAGIQAEAGIQEIVMVGNTIVVANGVLDTFRVFVVFGYGFLIALVIFILRRKSRRVTLMDTYTSAEFVHTPELLHYSSNFYAPFERLTKKPYPVLNLYEKVSIKIKEIGHMAESLFSSPKPAVTIFWIIIVFAIFFLGGVL